MKRGIVWLLALAFLSACSSGEDNPIPAMPVHIDLTDAGVWNVYGVAAPGDFRYFVKSLREPTGFPFTDQTFTGYGGVLVINGMDPFSGTLDTPLAYDMSCPVEHEADIRVRVDAAGTLEAVCPACGSKYDIFSGGGVATHGPAATDFKPSRRLQTYSCVKSTTGGYTIVR